MTPLRGLIRAVERIESLQAAGTVTSLRGLTLLVEGLPATVGTVVTIEGAQSHGAAPKFQKRAEVVGFDAGRSIVMMLDDAAGVRPGDRVITRDFAAGVRVGRTLLGRVVNGMGEPIDGRGPIRHTTFRSVIAEPLSAMKRRPIREVLPTGVRAIDLMTTVGKGQRIGIFAGPGVGKSTMLSMLARRASSDVNVIALVGERGREVRDFIDHALGEEGMRRSIVVVATSDEAPRMRVRAVSVACALAEHFRDQGLDVMFMLDSVTRLAHAQRQVGLAVGEPPATKGYTPSVFSLLPGVLERAGAVEADHAAARRAGSVTGFYAVLVEGDDLTEPVSDAVRGILDGHIVLSRKLAHKAHYPAIDVLESISRVANEIITPAHRAARDRVLRLLAAHRDVDELIQIGAYAPGSSPSADAAIRLKPRIDALLRQGVDEVTPMDEAREELLRLAKEAETLESSPARPGAPRAGSSAAPVAG